MIIAKPDGAGASLVLAGMRVAHYEAQNASLNYLCGQLARTDTVAKQLGVLPAGAVPCSLSWGGAANSNAATSATISVGYQGGTGTELLNAQDVKTNSVNQNFPAAGAALHTTRAADTVVTGVYAESGTASTAGGPWTVTIGYFLTG